MKKVLNHFGVFQSAWKVVSLWICALFCCFPLWTENKGGFTVTKRRLRLLPVALFPSNYHNSDLSPTSQNLARSLETLLRIHATSLNRSRGCVAGLYTWLHCSWIPTARRQLHQNYGKHPHNAAAPGSSNFPNISFLTMMVCLSPPPIVRKSSLYLQTFGRQLLCLARHNITKEPKKKEEESAAIQTLSHLLWSSLISNSECFMMEFFWTLPRCVPEHPLKFSPQSAPHQTKEKRTAPLALSPRWHSFPMSLALLSPALCSSLSADAPKLRQQL